MLVWWIVFGASSVLMLVLGIQNCLARHRSTTLVACFALMNLLWVISVFMLLQDLMSDWTHVIWVLYGGVLAEGMFWSFYYFTGPVDRNNR